MPNDVFQYRPCFLINDGPYQWRSKYTLDVNREFIKITLRLRIEGRGEVSTFQLQNLQEETQEAFMRYFDRRFLLIDPDGLERLLHTQLDFLEEAADYTIWVYPGKKRVILDEWYTDSLWIDRVHELGHILGLKDEYVDIGVDERKERACSSVFRDHSLMGDYIQEGIWKADIKLRHGKIIAKYISEATGTSFLAKICPRYVFRKGDTLSWLAKRFFGDEKYWWTIYRHNRGLINDPFQILPGTQIKLPTRKELEKY